VLLLLYDIEGRRDPHGIRVRLVRALRKSAAFQLQRSAWLLEDFNDELRGIIDEFRRAGGAVKLAEWLPKTLAEAGGAAKTVKILVAVHGVEPIIKGHHSRIRDLLESLGFMVTISAVGESATSALGRASRLGAGTAAIEKSISRGLDEAGLADIDGVVFLNAGRSTRSGIIFGAQTIAKTKVVRNASALPFIQLERIGEPDGAVILWSEAGGTLARRLAEALRLPVITPSVEARRITKEGGREIRQIHFAMAGDTIVANGLKIGLCTTDQVYLVAEGGRLIDILGGKMLKRQAKRLVFGSISEVIVKTVPPS